MTYLIVLIGSILIIFGRKAIWLGIFSGVLIASNQILSYILFDQPETTTWIIAGIIASISLVLYLTLEKAMVILLGSIGGGFLAFTIIKSFHFTFNDTFITKLAIFLAGSLIGILLLKLIFEWAITAFTSLIGAYLIASLIVGQPLIELFLLFILTAVGIAIQGKGKISTRHSDFQKVYSETVH